MQVYFRPTDATQPVRLIGWASAVVSPGGTADVEVTCDARAMRRWVDAGWEPLVDGALVVARGLGDVRLRLPLA